MSETQKTETLYRAFYVPLFCSPDMPKVLHNSSRRIACLMCKSWFSSQCN